MLVGKKNFPYPVLNKDITYSTIEGVKFKINDDHEIYSDDEAFIIENIYYKLNDISLNKYIDNDMIKVYLIVECSTSVFREKYEIFSTSQDIKVDINNLKDKVEISAYGVVIKRIEKYKLNTFNQFYKGLSFVLEKNNIVLIDDGYSTKVQYDESEDDITRSIFSIVKDMNSTDLITINSDQNKIRITIPEEQFNIYEQTKGLVWTSNMYFSILVIPALLQELTMIKEKVKSNQFYEDIEDVISEYYWFKAIVVRYETVYGKELTLEKYGSLNILELSQQLINDPIVQGISEIGKLLVTEVDNDDEY